MAELPPSVLSIAPSSGITNGGTAVTITGLHFEDGDFLYVQIGGVAVASYVVVSDVSITAVTGAHAPGIVDVVVGTTIGSGILEDQYTYTGGSVMATILGVNETLIQAGSVVDTHKKGGLVRYAQDQITLAGEAAATVVSFGIRLKTGDIPISFWFYTAALSTTGTLDFGLHSRAADGTLTAIDVDCFADDYVSSAAALKFSGNDGLTTITAAILAGTVTNGLGGIGVPMTANGNVTMTVNTAAGTGLVIFGLTYAAAP